MASWWARSTSATTKRIRKLLPQICAIQKDSWNSRLGRRHIPFGQRRHTSVFFCPFQPIATASHCALSITLLLAMKYHCTLVKLFFSLIRCKQFR